MSNDKVKKNAAKPEADNNSRTIKRIKRIVSSLVLAAILWFVTINIVNPSITVSIANVPIRFVGESSLRDKGLVLVDRDLLPDFAVKVRGTRRDLLDGMDRIRIDIDLSGIQNQGSITVTPSVSLPDSVSLERQMFSGVQLNIEPSYEKEIPVIIKQTGDDKLKSKGKIVRSEPEQSSMQIIGSREEVDSAAGCTITIDVSALRESGKTMYSYNLTDSSAAVLQKITTIYCSNVTVAVTNTILNRVTCPVSVSLSEKLSNRYIINLKEESLNPTEMDIGVPDGANEPSKLEAVVRDRELESGDRQLSLDVEVPNEIYVKDRRVTIDANITELEERTAAVTVNIENTPENLTVQESPVTETKRLLVPKDYEGEIKASADASEAHDGRSELKIDFEDDRIRALDGDKIGVIFSITNQMQ